MAFRRIALSILVVAALAAACASDEPEAGISVDEPIGAPDGGGEYDGSSTASSSSGERAASVDPGPSVIKDASVAMEVASDELTAAAQKIVDLTTGPRVDGYLVSSVVDLENGYGYGEVAVKVPSSRFEQVVGDLASIGRITLQRLQGEDLSSDFLQARASVARAEDDIASLLRQLDKTDDAAVRFQIRQDIADAKHELARFQQNETYIRGETAYSNVEVALEGTRPAPPPAEPVFERALGTAKAISLAIGSGLVLAAGVLIPLGVVAFLLYLIGGPIVRKLKPRLGA